MMVSLKAVVYERAGRIRVKDVPVPRGRKDFIRARIGNASICGTDMHFYTGEWSAAKGVILGHDASGIATESGSRVALEFLRRCGKCSHCLSGHENLCSAGSFMGFDSDGFFAEEVVVPAVNTYRIPDSMSMEEAACLEPVALAVHTLNMLKPRNSRLTVILGQGPVGLCLTQVAKLWDCRVLAVDLHDHKLRLASEYGADNVANAADCNLRREVKRLSRGLPVDVIEAAGTSEAVSAAQEIVTPDGRVAFASGAADSVELKWETEYNGVVAYTIPEKKKAIQMLQDGMVDVGRMITHRFKLSDFDAAARTALDPAKKAIKIVLHN